MYVRKALEDNSGFSLVEVILAVVILALVTLPIVNYFTYSSLQTIDGRDRQSATLAGESVMEEISSYSNYGEIKNLIATPGPSSTPNPSASPVPNENWEPDPDNPKYTQAPNTLNIQREVMMNGFKHQARVHIDFSQYTKDTKTVDGEDIPYLYNDYEIPRPAEVYGESNVVAVEDSQYDEVVSEFYLRKNATMTQVQISQKLSRILVLQINKESGDLYRIRVGYRYLYDGNDNDDYYVSIEDTTIEKDKFKNIFVFYNVPMQQEDVPDGADTLNQWTAKNSDLIQIKVDPQIAAAYDEHADTGWKIFLACQNANAVDTRVKTNGDRELIQKVLEIPSDYKLKWYSGSNTAGQDVALGKTIGYYANVESDGSFVVNDYVYKDKIPADRIAKIIVDIYEENATEPTAHLETTKSE